MINFSYDQSGNVASVTPPGRPRHLFSFTPVDLDASYDPPSPLGGGGLGGGISYSYNPTTGNLETVIAPDGGTLNYTWDGSLLTGTTWIGPVTGSVTRTYDSDFRTSSITANGDTIGLTYDADSLLTKAGDLAITRDPQNGLVTGTSLGSATTTQAYNVFGEIIDQRASYAGGEVYSVQYTRDTIGRIIQKTETIQSEPHTYAYAFDPAGRLTEVKKDGAVVSQYAYDSNSNRLSLSTFNPGPSTVTATYDAQDRLLSVTPSPLGGGGLGGGVSYGWTPNGELSGKTDASGTAAYQYDVLGNLRSVLLPNGTFIEYLIDGRNRRIGKKVNGALTQGFLWQDQLKPTAELDASSAKGGRSLINKKSLHGCRPIRDVDVFSALCLLLPWPERRFRV